MTGVYITTETGYKKLLDELGKLKQELNIIIAARNECDEKDGNPMWHSNTVRDGLEQKAYAIGLQIRASEKIISQCIIEKRRLLNTKKIDIGSIVEYQDITELESSSINIIEITYYGEGDQIANHKVSYTAPLALSMMSKEPGDIVNFMVNKKERIIKIIKLHDKWPGL